MCKISCVNTHKKQGVREHKEIKIKIQYWKFSMDTVGGADLILLHKPLSQPMNYDTTNGLWYKYP